MQCIYVCMCGMLLSVWSLCFSAVCGLLFPMNTNVLQTPEINPPPPPLTPSLLCQPPSLSYSLSRPSFVSLHSFLHPLYLSTFPLFHLTFYIPSFSPPQMPSLTSSFLAFFPHPSLPLPLASLLLPFLPLAPLLFISGPSSSLLSRPHS